MKEYIAQCVAIFYKRDYITDPTGNSLYIMMDLKQPNGLANFIL